MTHTKPIVTMTEDVFLDYFKPIPNHIDANASWGGCMFETYDEELEFVRRQPSNCIWTIVDADNGMAICSGFHLVNRIGYLVASVPAQAETVYDIVCEDLSADEWMWEEAFDKFGFGDGDGHVRTNDIARAITSLGYIVTQTKWGMHNTVITSIIDISGAEQIDSSVRIGYANPREFLPEHIISHLDRKFDYLPDKPALT